MEFVNGLGLLALGSRLRALSERLYALADEVYARQGIAIQGRWFPALRMLHDRGPSTVGEIAEAIGQTHSAVSQMADRLVRDGWLVAAPDARDGRVRRLALSAKADAALREAKPAWRAIQEVLDARIRAAGTDVLATLDRLAVILDDTLAPEIVARTSALRRNAVRIVPFRPELRDHFHRLNAAWLTKYFYIEEIDERVLRNPEREILDRGGAIFFAILDDAVVGTCALKEEGAGEIELTKMAVDERYQGLGIGRLLIEATIAEFRRRCARELFLETNSRLTPAIRLYESVGFRHQPAVKSDSHYRRADVYMVWQDPAPRARRKPVRKATAKPRRTARA
jgi:ribosomal protein S18 acetylase RimI-like enzyme/DNA-binding MarR family transcriptional regulator